MRKMYVNILNKKVAVCTLGCKVNQYESDSMMDILKKNGCEIVPFSQFADVYIVNTCSVTNMAERKSRQMLHRAKKKESEGCDCGSRMLRAGGRRNIGKGSWH